MEEVTKKGYNIALDNNEFKLVTADGMDVYENNQRVGFKDFTDRLLAQHKLLKVAGEQTPANQQTQTQTTTTVQTGNRTNRFSSRAEELASEALRDLNS
jgi:hypothetical protein